MFFIFFFQAEDGIRDGTVTGVQTCALPIFTRVDAQLRDARAGHFQRHAVVEMNVRHQRHMDLAHDFLGGAHTLRSEERRVGKECRSGWWAYDEKENDAAVLCVAAGRTSSRW